jgi:ACS family tartrate transporter-like MFS transporter
MALLVTESIDEQTISRLNRRIVPLFFVIYIINFLDRVNVGFAALQMNQDLGFNAEMYGFGAGIFFIGYVIFEIPSNMMLTKVGARYWLSRIMVSWGVVAAAMAFVHGSTSFYILRFLLGVAEAGFVPALLVYLNEWYPARERAGVVSKIWSATAVSIVIGGPISGLILSMNGVLGVTGWQWMFVIEGVPAIFLGVFLFLFVTDKPEQAKWLTAPQREWLVSVLAAEEAQRQKNEATSSFAAAFRDPRIWVLGFMYACLGFGFFGITLWLPQVVKQVSQLSNLQTSFVTAIPFICAVVAMIVVGKHSDRTGERRWHIVAGTLVAALGFAISGNVADPVMALVAISIGAMGLWSVIAVFWQIPSKFLTGAAAAVGVAIINSCGSMGGFVGPYVIGWIRSHSPGFGAAMLAVAAAMLIAAAIAVAFGGRHEPVPVATTV